MHFRKKETHSSPLGERGRKNDTKLAGSEGHRITDLAPLSSWLFQVRVSAELCVVGQGKVMWRKPRLYAASAEKRFLLTHTRTRTHGQSPVGPRRDTFASNERAFPGLVRTFLHKMNLRSVDLLVAPTPKCPERVTLNNVCERTQALPTRTLNEGSTALCNPCLTCRPLSWPVQRGCRHKVPEVCAGDNSEIKAPTSHRITLRLTGLPQHVAVTWHHQKALQLTIVTLATNKTNIFARFHVSGNVEKQTAAAGRGTVKEGFEHLVGKLMYPLGNFQL